MDTHAVPDLDEAVNTAIVRVIVLHCEGELEDGRGNQAATRGRTVRVQLVKWVRKEVQ